MRASAPSVLQRELVKNEAGLDAERRPRVGGAGLGGRMSAGRSKRIVVDAELMLA